MFKRLKIIILTITISLSSFTIGQASQGSTKVPILLYHHILSESENTNQKDNSCVVSLEDFEKQMKYLYDNGFYTITPKELSDFLYLQKPLPPKSVMINFDDGYYSNVTRAYPVLKKYGFKATVFLITDAVKDEQEAFNPQKLTFIAKPTIKSTKDVFEYASHTNNLHSSKKNKTGLFLANKKEIMADIKESFKIVNNEKIFAYPLGQYNSLTLETLSELKVNMAVTTKPGYVTKDSYGLELKRFIIYRTTSMTNFKKIVDIRL